MTKIIKECDAVDVFLMKFVWPLSYCLAHIMVANVLNIFISTIILY